MENRVENNELKEMRQQMAELKERLNEQLCLNEERLQDSIMKQTNKINNFGLVSLTCGNCAIVAATIVLYHIGVSPLCYMTFVFFAILDSAYDYWTSHMVTPKDLSKMNTKEVISSLIRMKTAMRWDLYIAGPVAFFLLIWIVVEIYQQRYGVHLDINNYKTVLFSSIVPVLIGVLIGIVVITYFYRKQKGNINDLLKMLQDE